MASHPLFSVRGWDPTRPARDALLLLKAFLEVGAASHIGWPTAACGAAQGRLHNRRVADTTAIRRPAEDRLPSRRVADRGAWVCAGDGNIGARAWSVACSLAPGEAGCWRSCHPLQKNARVDFGSPRNVAGPLAYLPVEVRAEPSDERCMSCDCLVAGAMWCCPGALCEGAGRAFCAGLAGGALHAAAGPA